MLSDFVKKLIFVRQFDVIDGKFEVLGVKSALVSPKVLVDLQEKNPAFVYKSFKESMKRDSLVYCSRLGDTKDFILVLADFFEVLGIGKLRITDIDLKAHQAILEVYDCPLCMHYLDNKKPASSPVCFATAGILAGICCTVLGTDVDAVESTCLARGDACCQFVVK